MFIPLDIGNLGNEPYSGTVHFNNKYILHTMTVLNHTKNSRPRLPISKGMNLNQELYILIINIYCTL
jgi:hypothetical protein